MLNFFPTCRIGFQKDHLCFIGLRFLPLKRRRSRQLLPINYGESLQIIYSISGISPQEGRVAFKKCHICCVTIERNVPGKTKRKAAKRKSLPYFTSLASRISDQVSTTEDTTFRGSQKGGKDDHEIHPKYLTLKIKLPLYQNTSKRHL